MAKAPNTYDAEAIPEATRAAVDRLMASGDLFRYTHPETAAVPALEAEFAAMIGARYALALSSCSAAIFLSIRALDLPPGGRILVPDLPLPLCPRRWFTPAAPRCWLRWATTTGLILMTFRPNSTMEFPLS